MQAENWQQVKEILNEVITLDAAGRLAFLDGSGISSEIRSEVEALIVFEERSTGLMQLSAVEFSKDFIDDDTELLSGHEVGPYRLIRELGIGGMGAVYLAERIDGKFKQQVALKLLKREMNTGALRRHFEQEREILASLDHPNIARLLDAGTTADHIPFISMEYVDGQPIDEYCNSRNLDLNARLDLFRAVCGAVDFAHRNLVVHRDLKPSNVLVTRDGVPKLLDFGIAKILSKNYETADAATITRLGVMTPSYASPEQLRQQGVTTLTDVYSLGVILFELLSGHRPFEAQEHDLRATYDAVMEKQPPRPSSVITGNSLPAVDAVNGKTREHFTRQTGANSGVLSPQAIKGDLDNIVLKALRKEPERRYSSPGNLAEDIHRHLRGLTVTARPNTFGYRASKFIARNRFAAAAGGVILLAIVGGVIATLWQARVASAERAKAEKRFEDVRSLANSFLFEFSPKIENLPGSMPARELLVTRALEYLNSLSLESGGDLELRSELAKAFEKVGDVQGNPGTPNIGDLKGALESYQKAQDIRRELLAADPGDADAMANLANNLEIVADINLNGGEYAKAGTDLAEAVTLREKVVEQKPSDLSSRAALAKAVRISGFVPFYESENEKALEFFNRSLEIVTQLEREFPGDPYVGYLHANVLIDIGDSYGYLDKMDVAEQNIQKGLDMLIALRSAHPNDNRIRRALFVAYLKRGEYSRDLDDLPGSLAAYDKSLEIAQLALRGEPGSFQAKRDMVLANKQRAVTLKAADKPRESIQSFQRAIDISEQLKTDDPNNFLVLYDICGTYYEISDLLSGINDSDGAIDAAQKSIDNCAEVLAKNPSHNQSHRVTARARHMLGTLHAGRGDSRQKALENYRSSLEIYGKLKADGKSISLDEKAVTAIEAEIGRLEGR